MSTAWASCASLVLQKQPGLLCPAQLYVAVHCSSSCGALFCLWFRYFDSFERQLLAPNLGTFSQYVDPDALVDWFLANELIKSANDGYRGSVYFWKDADKACKYCICTNYVG